jgi:ketosteroid isomerase-like protein
MNGSELATRKKLKVPVRMKRIEDFFEVYKQSAWNKDSQSMIALYDDNVVVFDMWKNGYQVGLSQRSIVIEDWLGSLGEEKVNVIFEMIEIHDGGNVGFATALITYQAISTSNTILRSMKTRITVGFVKQKDVWKVIHQHTSCPVDSDLKAILNF